MTSPEGNMMALFDASRIDYDRYSNRQLVAVPAVVFAFAIVVLVGWTILTGAPVSLGVEFVGGTELRIATDGATSEDVRNAFSVTPDTVRSLPDKGAYLVTFKSGVPVTQIEQSATDAGYKILASSEVSPSFGSDSQRLALYGLGIAFLGMSLIVYLLFRTFVPSIAVIASAMGDIIVPIAVMNIVGIDLSLGVVAALLMLVGYSVDSDILLNDHVLRRGGSFYESVEAAMDTGVTMTLTSLSAMIVLTIGATILGVPLLRDIGFIITIGLVVDLMNTYMMNLSLLRWYKFEGVAR